MAAVSRVVHTTCDKNTLAHGLVVIETGPHKCALALNMAIEHRTKKLWTSSEYQTHHCAVIVVNRTQRLVHVRGP